MKREIIFLSAVILTFILACRINSQVVNRNQPPLLPPPSALNLPAIQQFVLSNGLKVYLMEKHEVPVVQLNVVVKAGVADDPAGKDGAASMTAAMLTEGAAGKSSLEIADAIDFLGARIYAGPGYNYTDIALHTPLSKFNDALRLLADIVLRPDFPVNELNRKKKERLTNIMQWHDQPTAIAGIAFSKLLFGSNYAYGKPAIGSEETIKSFIPSGLKNFYDKYFNSANSFIVAVGDIDKDNLKKDLEREFGGWKTGEANNNKLQDAPQVEKTTVYLIDKPGAPQSVIYIGRIGLPRITPDYNAVYVMNTILGGSFSSRINQNLREKNGFTYGASSNFSFREAAGAFTATSSVQSEVTDKALSEFFKELNGIREPVPADELERAKNYVALGYPGNFQTVRNIAAQLEEKIEFNLPDDYFNKYISNILSVSNQEVNTAAQKYIEPVKMVVVVVGDKNKIEDGIKKLNLGELKNLSIEDVLGKIPKIE